MAERWRMVGFVTVAGTLTIDGLRVPTEVERLDDFRAWVDSLGEGEPLSFRLLVLQPAGPYSEAEPDAEGFRASPVWRHRFRIDTGTDRAGHPTYRLIVS